MTAVPFKSDPTPLSPESRLDLFDGALLVAAQVPAMTTLVDHATHMLANAFHGLDPRTAHDTMDRDAYLARVRAVRRAFNEDTGIRGVMDKLVDQLGGDGDDAYLDRINLRMTPPAQGQGEDDWPRPVGPLPPHRDTWGSNIMAQINLWAPLAELNDDATMILYPGAFAQAVSNSSADWDLEELHRHRAEGRPRDYPHMPVMTCEKPASPVPVRIEAGDVLLFSGAHLHAGGQADQGPARLSLDTRLVFLGDHLAGRGAPNVDGMAPRQPLDWFSGLKTGLPLSQAAKPAGPVLALAPPTHS